VCAGNIVVDTVSPSLISTRRETLCGR